MYLSVVSASNRSKANAVVKVSNSNCERKKVNVPDSTAEKTIKKLRKWESELEFHF